MANRLASGIPVDARKVLNLRLRAVLTQAELATATGLGKRTIYRAEHGVGVLRASAVRRIAEVLGVEPGELVAVDDDGTAA